MSELPAECVFGGRADGPDGPDRANSIEQQDETFDEWGDVCRGDLNY